MAAAFSHYVIEIPNTSYDRHLGTAEYAYQDRALIARADAFPSGDLAAAFQMACNKLMEECRGEAAGSTFAAGFIVPGSSGSTLLTAHVGDSGLCLLTFKAGGEFDLSLFTSRHLSKERIKPEVGSVLEGIRPNRALGDKDYNYKGSGFTSVFEFQTFSLPPSEEGQYLLAFSDGFADFLGVDALLEEVKYKELLVKKLKVKFTEILAGFDGKSSRFDYCMQEFKRQMLFKAASTPGLDDTTLLVISIAPFTLAAVADGHGLGKHGTRVEADATAKKAISRFPGLLADKFCVPFAVPHISDESWVSKQKDPILVAMYTVPISDLVVSILTGNIAFSTAHTLPGALAFFSKHGPAGRTEMSSYITGFSDRFPDEALKRFANLTSCIDALKAALLLHYNPSAHSSPHSRDKYIKAAYMALDELGTGRPFEDLESELSSKGGIEIILDRAAGFKMPEPSVDYSAMA